MLLFLIGFFWTVPAAVAQTTIENGCLQEVYTAGSGDDNGLNCTANDVDISLITTNNVRDRCLNTSDTATLDLYANIELNATARYDLGVYVGLDGGNAKDLGGTCSITILPVAPDPPWVDLDQSVTGQQNDTCGDLDSAHSPLNNVFLGTRTVSCANADPDGCLLLGFCTSWRQSGANDFCDEPTDAFPGTTSKCNCGELRVNDPGCVPVDYCSSAPLPSWDGTVVETGNGTGYIDLLVPAGGLSLEFVDDALPTFNLQIDDITDWDGNTYSWTTSGTNADGYPIYDDPNGVDGAPDSIRVYVSTLQNGRQSRFFLHVTDDCGQTVTFDPVIELSQPNQVVLDQNYPNPFNPTTQIEFLLDTESEVHLAIYDVAGRLVRTLASDLYEAGHHRVFWDGTNQLGVSVPSGVYIYRLQAGGAVLSRLMTLQR